MEIFLKVLFILIGLTLCVVNGFAAPILLPVEEYGYSFLIISAGGGFIIGYFGSMLWDIVFI